MKLEFIRKNQRGLIRNSGWVAILTAGVKGIREDVPDNKSVCSIDLGKSEYWADGNLNLDLWKHVIPV